MDLAGPIIEMLNCLMPPVCRHLEHHRNLQQNMEEMRRRLGDLNSLKEDIESRKQTAEASSTKAVRREVQRWLVNVQTINNEIQIVEEKFQNVSCLCRGSLGKRVEKKIEELKRLLQVGSFPEDIVIDKPPSSGKTLPTKDAIGRSDVQEKIREYLMGNDVGIIGVWGPGGIGKTTIMKNIHNDLLNESKFNKVIWATVPYPVSVVKLQDNIVSNINDNKEKLPENVTEEQRAATLSEILSKMRYVLILDDAWGRFSFEDVGIPKPTQQNGCKVIITSRSVDTCNYIGCEQVIRMQQLPEKESLNLFLDTVGHDVLLKIPNLKETLKLVVAECAGLPLAIVVIARSMRGANDISAWKYALFELKSRVKRVNDWDEKIFERLKFSYDRLNDAELQNCFLHCSLYAKDGIRRADLIESWIDNALIEQLETRKLMRDRANAILDSLINKCLIERVDYSFACYIRMHDVMRDMALQVAGPRFMAKAGLHLNEVPKLNEWTANLEMVSLQFNSITDFASIMSVNCPKLSGLDLSWSLNLRQIPDSFLARMIGLKFLTLSESTIEVLPASISNLENLTVLRLAYCRNLRHMPSLVNLKALKKLDLKQAGILEVPQGMEMLVNLEHLNLECPYLVEPPMEILCNLTHLQFLAVALRRTSSVRKAEKVNRLKVLETFIGQFDDLPVFNNFVKSLHEDQKFTSYCLTVGFSYERYAFDGRLKLHEFETGGEYFELSAGGECTKIIFLSRVEIGRDYSVLLPNDVQLLKITDCSDVKILSETSLFNTATDLRYCEINDCEGLECMLDLFSWSSVRSSFDKLEILWLKNLHNLQVLVKVEAQAASAPSTSRAPRPTSSSIFSNLKIFKIRDCRRIKKLFPFELLKGLQNLEEIYVGHCQRVEEIIEAGDEKETNTAVGNSETTRLGLPKLSKLSLEGLPKLKSICTTRGVMVCDSLQSIEIYDCPMLNRIPLYLPLLPNGELSLPSSIQEIRIESEVWWELLLWDNPSAKDIFLPFLKICEYHCDLEKQFYDLEDFNDYVESIQGQKFTSYELYVIANVDDYHCDNSSDAVSDYDFPIDDDDCSKSLALSGIEINEDYPVLLPDDLQLLDIAKCCGFKSLNDAFVFKALSDLRSCPPCPPTQPSMFSNLENLLIYKCPSIKKLFTSELLKGLQNLKRIYIIGCATMEEIIEVEEEKESLKTDGGNETITFILPKLKGLLLVGLPNLKSICTAGGVIECDSLEKIGIVECPKLKRIPLSLPVLPDGEPYPPPSLRGIYMKSRECWKSMVWDKLSSKDILDRFLNIKEHWPSMLEQLTDASETEDE